MKRKENREMYLLAFCLLFIVVTNAQGNAYGNTPFVFVPYNWSNSNGGVGYYIAANHTRISFDLYGNFISNTTGSGCFTIVWPEQQLILYNLTCTGVCYIYSLIHSLIHSFIHL